MSNTKTVKSAKIDNKSKADETYHGKANYKERYAFAVKELNKRGKKCGDHRGIPTTGEGNARLIADLVSRKCGERYSFTVVNKGTEKKPRFINKNGFNAEACIASHQELCGRGLIVLRLFGFDIQKPVFHSLLNGVEDNVNKYDSFILVKKEVKKTSK